MTDLAFLVDAPDVMTLAAGVATSRVQIAKTGKFKDPRYGNFAITVNDFDRWMQNFSQLSVADGRAGLPVDVDHGPEKTGNTEAAGWVIKLDRMGKDGRTSSPNELWATVEWNTLGQDLVKDRRYLYLSPSYHHNFQDETGKTHGTALVGVGLTNRPFLTMATVSLSQHLAVEEVAGGSTNDPETSGDSLSQMSDLLSTLREKFNLAADADEATVLAAVNDAATKAAASADATPGDINLSAVAASQGMVVLSAADHLKLASDAAAGATAAQELHLAKFDTAWNAAVTGKAVLPAMKQTFELSYKADADNTIKTLNELPRSSNAPAGYTGDPAEDATVEATQLAQSDANSEGWGIDAERADLDRKATELSASENIPYGQALDRVMAGTGA